MEGVDRMVVGQDVILGDREVPVKDLEKLSFDSPHVALAKNTSTQRPVNVPESGIICVLGRCKSRQHETSAGRGPGLRCETNLGG